MSTSKQWRAELQTIEDLILGKFKTEPFHNLYLACGYTQTTLSYGGTCSDKALSVYEALRARGIEASLHAAFIGGAEIHRLVRVTVGGDAYFADVGNGWPSVKMYPCDRDIAFSCYGIRFRSVISRRHMSVYSTRNGAEYHQMDICFERRSEAAIRGDIEVRFQGGIEYPFSRGIRFSMVVGERFLFLRDEQLGIYSATAPYEEVSGIDRTKLHQVLKERFGFDLETLAPRTDGCAPLRSQIEVAEDVR